MKKGEAGVLEAKHKSIHHIVPTSRGGPKESWNEYPWIIKKHRNWHVLTHNYLPSEVITLIGRHWTLPDGQLNKEKMGERFYRAWQKVFSTRISREERKKGEKAVHIWGPREAIKFIEEEFLPAERRFLEIKFPEKR